MHFLFFFFFNAEIPHGGLCQMWRVQMHLDGAAVIDVSPAGRLGGRGTLE